METPVALKYAKALFEIGMQSDDLELIYKDAKDLLDVLAQSQPFAEFVANPMLSHQDRERGVKTLFSGKLSPGVYQFILLLASKERLSHLKDILIAFENMYFEQTGTVRVRVISPFELKTAKFHELVEHLAKQFHKKIEPTLEINRALIGGIKIQIKDQVHDFSVKSQLEKFQKQLLQA